MAREIFLRLDQPLIDRQPFRHRHNADAAPKFTDLDMRQGKPYSLLSVAVRAEQDGAIRLGVNLALYIDNIRPHGAPPFGR